MWWSRSSPGIRRCPAGADSGRPWRASRSLDPGRLGEADSVVAEGPLRAAIANHPRGAIVLLRRDADAGPRPRKGPHKGLSVLGPCVDDRPWGGPAPPAVAYVFADGRGKDEIAAQLIDYAGILQVDGYAAYKSLTKYPDLATEQYRV
jgi:hypothetical protein